MVVPEVTIVVSSFNKEAFIAETIKCIQAQTFQNWELVIVDDCSGDNSFEIIKHYSERDLRIKYFLNDTNRGANFSRNRGINMATGQYLVFLDADDLLSETCLERRIGFMREHENLQAAIFPMQLFKKRTGDMQVSWIPKKKNALQRFMSHDLPWSIMQPIWKSTFVKSIGGFDEAFFRLEDVDFHTRALLSENFKYEIVNAGFDCFYRVAEERKVYNPFDFLQRTCDSAVLYYNKYYRTSSLNNSFKLSAGTIYHAYYSVLQNFKNSRISRKQFLDLEKILFNSDILNSLSFFQKTIFRIAKLYHLYFLRVPGINRFLFKLLIA